MDALIQTIIDFFSPPALNPNALTTGIAAMVIYAIKELVNRRFPGLVESLLVLISASMVVHGIYFCTLAYEPWLNECINVSRLSLLVGGVASIWLSISKIVDTFSQRSEKPRQGYKRKMGENKNLQKTEG